MPETSQEWYARVSGALEDEGYRETGLAGWSSWPWTGTLTPKPLDPPVDAEPPRRGAGGVDCHSCRSGADPEAAGAIWWDDLWFMVAADSSSLPFATFLMPRRHADLADLTPEEAGRQGELLAAVEGAATASLHIPRIQVARWGDGGEHLHWWLYARPTGMLQLRGTFLSHWDDLLPPVPPEQSRADQLLVVRELVARAGGRTADG